MIPQNKGRDLSKIPQSRIPEGPFYVSKKFDGHYIQLHFIDGELYMYTSGGKEFYLHELASYIKLRYKGINFKIECEFNYDCEGKLGDRSKSAIVTTYRTNYLKGIRNNGDSKKDIFRVLDILDMGNTPFVDRLNYMISVFGSGDDWLHLPHFYNVDTLDEATKMAKDWQNRGFEGAMVKTFGHVQQPGKRTNDIVKLKPRLTADLLCVGWKQGTGKYEGMIGSLLLEDSHGRQVYAGSGLNDTLRNCAPQGFMHTVIEIEYERIDDTYIQPIIKHIRSDKKPEDID